jgi:hypothetical protein
MDYLKSVVEPIRQVVPSSRLRGLIEDYDSVNTDVLVLEGETHLNRKPVRLLHIEYTLFRSFFYSYYIGCSPLHINCSSRRVRNNGIA